MKGDFSVLRDEREKHYNRVLKQQGRVDLDRDWNEQMQIQSRLDRIRTADVVGPCGAPNTRGGFKVGAYRSLGAHLYDVHFADPLTGWAVGNMGIILTTRDGGKTWLPQTSGTNACFHGVCFVDASNGWVVGHAGHRPVILVTNNGGESWTHQTPTLPLGSPAKEVALTDVCFVNESQGWAVGYTVESQGSTAGTLGLILATGDGGQRWKVVWQGKKHGTLMGVSFVSKSVGYAVGTSGTVLIFRPEEGWKPLEANTTDDMQFFDVDCIDEYTICAVGVRTLGPSTGPGIIVTIRENKVALIDEPGTFFLGVSFVDNSTGWIVGFQYAGPDVAGTHDVDFDILDIDVLDRPLSHAQGIVWTTRDRGTHWTASREIEAHLVGLSLVSESRGWAVGRGLGPHVPAIISSGNAGRTWTSWKPPHDADLAVWDGRIYVDGVVCELESPTTYLHQLDYLDPPPVSPPRWKEERTDLVFLDVWQRHITAIEDPDIRETALEGPDTTTRVKTVWQVKVQKDVNADKCVDNIQEWPPSPSEGRMSTNLSMEEVEQRPCVVAGGGEYRGLGNQLYRVEVHDGGQPYAWPRPAAAAVAVTNITPEDDQVTVANPLDSRPWRLGELVEVFSKQTDGLESKGLLARIVGASEPQPVGDDETQQVLTLASLTDNVDLDTLAGQAQVRLRRVASCKWSRDNGSVAFAIDQFVTDDGPSTNQLVLRGLGRSPAMELRLGDWVEVTDDVSELKGEPGTLAQVSEPVDPEKGIVTLSKDISGYSLDAHPKLRRWDQKEETIAVANDWIDLEEHGIRISFSGSNFKSADYWVFATRAATGEIETLDNEPPRGIPHDYCALALVVWKDDGTADVTDLRQRFPASAELASCFYLGGDAQEGSPGDPLPQPLRVGVAQGEWPISAATVRFRVVDGNGELQGPDGTDQEVLVSTDKAGVAACIWVLGNGSADQLVEAMLLDACGHSLHLPICFNANFAENGQPNGLCWRLGGNEIDDPSREYLGTRNEHPMEIRVQNTRALRLEPGDMDGNPAPNVIGGAPNNSIQQGTSGATIAGGHENHIVGDGGLASIGGGSQNKAAGIGATVSGGDRNESDGRCAAIAGGSQNKAMGDYATVAGGLANTAEAAYATIAGGGPAYPRTSTTIGNRVTDEYGTVSGGGYNQAGDDDGDTKSAMYATVGGGDSNKAAGGNATVGGGRKNFAEAGFATVAGGANNRAGDSASVLGGSGNKANGDYAAVGGGGANAAEAAHSSIGGGEENVASGPHSTIGGGHHNKAEGDHATVAGGSNNTAGKGASVAGGYDNDASADGAAVCGGSANKAWGVLAIVPGGCANSAIGDFSFAAGSKAVAHHEGAFVWSDQDQTGHSFESETDNQFSVRATGGVRFVTGINEEGQPTAGVRLAHQASSWSQLITREGKANYVPANPRRVLEQLAKLPIASWNYRVQDPSVRHMGPVAEDFYAAFGLGEDQRYISTADAEGVALAAIQGLYQLVQEKDAIIARLKTETDELRLRIEKLEARLSDKD